MIKPLVRTWSWRPTIAMLLTVAACRGANRVDTIPSRGADSAETVADSTRLSVALYQSLYRFGTTRRDVRAELGTPITARADTVANRHVAAIDSVFIWTYEGLEFQFYWATPVQRELLLKASAAASHPRVARLGEPVRTQSAARRRLGPEQFSDVVADTTRLYFSVTEQLGAEDTLILSYVGGQLVRVAIAPYVD